MASTPIWKGCNSQRLFFFGFHTMNLLPVVTDGVWERTGFVTQCHSRFTLNPHRYFTVFNFLKAAPPLCSTCIHVSIQSGVNTGWPFVWLYVELAPLQPLWAHSHLHLNVWEGETTACLLTQRGNHPFLNSEARWSLAGALPEWTPVSCCSLMWRGWGVKPHLCWFSYASGMGISSLLATMSSTPWPSVLVFLILHEQKCTFITKVWEVSYYLSQHGLFSPNPSLEHQTHFNTLCLIKEKRYCTNLKFTPRGFLIKIHDLLVFSIIKLVIAEVIASLSHHFLLYLLILTSVNNKGTSGPIKFSCCLPTWYEIYLQ